MEKGITFGGLDAHKVSIKAAVLVAGATKPVEWQLANEKAGVRRMVRKVQRLLDPALQCVAARTSLVAEANLVAGGGAVVDSSQTRRSDQDRPPRCPQAG